MDADALEEDEVGVVDAPGVVMSEVGSDGSVPTRVPVPVNAPLELESESDST
jgi:hypothetical protein